MPHQLHANIRAKLAGLAMHLEDDVVAANAVLEALQHPDVPELPEMARLIQELPRFEELHKYLLLARDLTRPYRVLVPVPFDQ